MLLSSYRPLLAALLLSALGACNRNSNELPPGRDQPARFTDSVVVNGTVALRLVFLQRSYPTAGRDTIDVLTQRVPGSGYGPDDSLTLVLEACTTPAGSYSTCPVLVTATAYPGRDSSYLLYRFADPGFPFRPGTVRVGVLRDSRPGATHPLAGLYNHPASHAEALADSAYRYSLYARSYVLADGAAVVRLRAADTAEYNLTGRFGPGTSLAFDGLLSAGSTLLSAVAFDSVRVGTDTLRRYTADTTGGTLRDSLRLKRPLADGVNHLDLYLKK